MSSVMRHMDTFKTTSLGKISHVYYTGADPRV